MTTDHITALAAFGESETLEFKATTGARRKAAMTVCAFLNQGWWASAVEAAVAQADDGRSAHGGVGAWQA